MKKMTRALSAALAVLMLISCFTLWGGAEDASVSVVNGINTAFVSAFGKLVYKSTGYTAFRSFAEALEAIRGNGRIVFSGEVEIPSALGSKDKLLFIEGIGSKATGNSMKPQDNKVNLEGHVTLSNVSFVSNNKGVTLFTNGYNLNAANIDVTYTVVNNETGERKYSGPFTVTTVGAKSSSHLKLGGGYFTDVILTHEGISGESVLNIPSGEFDRVSVGAIGGFSDGNFRVEISGGNIKELRLGAFDGDFTGNIFVKIAGGTVEKIICGGVDGKMKGNISVAHTGGAVVSISDEAKVSDGGSVTYSLNPYRDIEIPQTLKYDHMFMAEKGSIVPVIDEKGEISGLAAFDEFDIASDKIITDKGEFLTKRGVFIIPSGKYRVEIIPQVALDINKDAKYVTGYADGTFAPQNNMTRAEAVTLLTRAISSEDYAAQLKYTSDFLDVPVDAWYASNVALFETAGLFDGVFEGEFFNPSANITRGEFVGLIYNIEKKIGEKDNYAELCKLVYNVSANIGAAELYDGFCDVEYYTDCDYAVYHAIANGYVTGYADGSFLPDGNITRAEVVTVVNRVMGRVPAEDFDTVFTDTADHWANGQITAAVGEYRVMGADGLAKDGTPVADYIERLMANEQSDLVIVMANNVYKKALAAASSSDITAEQKETLLASLERAKVASRTAKGLQRETVWGSPEDEKSWIYTDETGIFIRETHIKSNKPETEPVEIVQLSDIHFNYFNKRDIDENHSDLMSTKNHRTWLANGASVGFARKLMNYARFSDQTVLTGDILDALSWGAIEKMNDYIFRIDTDVLVSLGNHEFARQVEGKVPSIMSYAQMEEVLRENWLHDIFYESKVLKDKVMVITLDNATFKYREEQVAPLKADIRRARENGYIILIFQHIPICTNDPEDTAHVALRNENDIEDFYNNWLGNADTSGTSLEVYNLITQNADVVKGVFCGHLHGDFYTEILGSYTDENGNVVEAKIPQYVLMSAAFDNNKGHAMKIVVE